MRIWFSIVLPITLALTACTSGNVTPTSTIVRLDRSALTPTGQIQVADTPPTATPIPYPTITLTPTPIAFPSPARPVLPAESGDNSSTVEVVPVIKTEIMPQAQAQGSKNSFGGRLVFMTSSGGELYVVNTDGTGLRKLAGGVIDPVVSPDGKQVAFTRWDGADFGTLYALNLNDGEERAIVADIRQPKSPTWSPNSQEIMVSFQHGGLRDPQPECRTFDPDDKGQLPAVGKITKVHSGPKGVTICFIRLEDLQWGLRRITVATGQFEDMPADLYSYNPAWDPQQPWRVVYEGDKGLMQLDVSNGNRWPITTDQRDTGPVFSPDGQKLALTYKQHDHWEVYTLDLASGQRHRLTKPPLLANPQYNSAAPGWSPDGSQLAFITDRSGLWEIWVMSADGSNPHPLFDSPAQAKLGLEYRGVNERMLNWIP